MKILNTICKIIAITSFVCGIAIFAKGAFMGNTNSIANGLIVIITTMVFIYSCVKTFGINS